MNGPLSASQEPEEVLPLQAPETLPVAQGSPLIEPLPCGPCMVLNCPECEGWVDDDYGLRVHCPCAEAGHEEWDVDDDDDHWQPVPR